jgi:hypothetical protein
VRTLLPGIFDYQVTRLYKATDPDVGFTAAKFHSLCDGKGPTLSLIKTVAGHIFGGFTTISWDSSSGYKNDTQSFLFSVDKQTKYPIVKNYQYAIYCGASYGPIFGGGHDIVVYDNSNSNKSSYTDSNSGNCCYNLPKAPGKSYSILTDGEYNF